MRLKDFRETFLEELSQPEFAAGYLQAALEENDLDTFFVALRDVVQANGGMGKTDTETALISCPIDGLHLPTSPPGNKFPQLIA